MRFTSSTFAAFGILVQASIVLADFHVGYLESKNVFKQDITEACPSNYYNCDCFDNGNRAAYGANNDDVGQGLDSFSIGAGLCGVGKLNFYKQASDGHYKFFVDGGDGTSQGDCYSNLGTTVGCDSSAFVERLVCYSYICN